MARAQRVRPLAGPMINSAAKQIHTPSFRGDAKHRTRNLKIPQCAIAHLRSGADAPSRNDGVWIASSLTLLAMTVGVSLPPARADAAIDRKDHTRGITGAVGRQVGHEVADLPGMPGTAERKALLKFLVAVLVTELV